MEQNSKLKNKKLIIIAIVIIAIILLIIVLKEPITNKYKESKLENIKKDIVFTGQYLNNNNTATYINTSFYIDINKKRICYVKFFNFSSGKVSKESLISDKKLSNQEYNTIMDIVNNANEKKPKKTSGFNVCYKITYQDKTLYTDYEQTNTFTQKILWSIDKNIEI